MSEVPTKVIVNCETGETTIVPLTPEDIESMEKARLEDEAFRAKQEAEAQAKAEARAAAIAKLVTLGLTEDEAKALIN